MRSLHVDTGREMRGGQWQVLYLIEKLTDATLLAPRESPLFAAASKKRLDVRPLSFLTLRKLARGAGLVHVHDAHAHSLAVLAGANPLVVSRRVGFPVKKSFASRAKYAKATLFLAVSDFVAGQLRQAGVPPEKIRVIFDGVPIPPESRRESGRVVALASKPVSIQGLPVDYIDDLWEGLSAASVFVYKSEMEGLGSAALAAQAAGVPVVASAAGGLPEAVLHGQTGFIVADGDFATPVRQLLDNMELAEQMSRAARQRAQNEFSIDVMVKKTLAAYEELL